MEKIRPESPAKVIVIFFFFFLRQNSTSNSKCDPKVETRMAVKAIIFRTLTWEMTKVSVQPAFFAFVCSTPN